MELDCVGTPRILAGMSRSSEEQGRGQVSQGDMVGGERWCQIRQNDGTHVYRARVQKTCSL